MNLLINTLRRSLTGGFLTFRPIDSHVENKVVEVTKTLLQPILPTLSFVNGFKMRYAVKRRCRDCFLVMRDNRLYNICYTHPRHKAMSLTPHEKKLRILTWAGMSKKRPW